MPVVVRDFPCTYEANMTAKFLYTLGNIVFAFCSFPCCAAPRKLALKEAQRSFRLLEYCLVLQSPTCSQEVTWVLGKVQLIICSWVVPADFLL